MQILKKYAQWMLPAVLILFLLEVFTLPFVLDFTYAGRSEAPSHVLNYSTGKLKWQDSTKVDANGTAILSWFDSQYGSTVDSANGDKIVAPGTDGFNIVRLKNNAKNAISYTAVLYEIKENPEIPVTAELIGRNFKDTENFSMPKGVAKNKAVRAVKGTLGAERIQDFDINWLWEYFVTDKQDVIDTALGNKAAFKEALDVTVGLYIVVEDNGQNVLPKTGDAGITMYLTLIGISGLLLILLIIAKRRENDECEDLE